VPATEALSDEPLPLAAEGAALPEAAAVPPGPRRPAVDPPAESSEGSPTESPEESPTESPTEEPPRPARAGPRDGADFGADDSEDESDDPVEPPEPVVSANATGNDATADPTPNATANAPTRPTYAAFPAVADSVAVTARRPYSIARTRPRDTRR